MGKRLWIWAALVGEEGAWNSAPDGPPIELAEAGQVFAAARGKQSSLKEAWKALALALGKPTSPRDIPRGTGSNLVLVKGERLFSEDMGRRVAQLLALLFGDGLSSLDTHLLRKGRLGSGTPVDRGSRVWQGRRRALRGIHVPDAEGGGARAKPKKSDRPPGICSIANSRVCSVDLCSINQRLVGG